MVIISVTVKIISVASRVDILNIPKSKNTSSDLILIPVVNKRWPRINPQFRQKREEIVMLIKYVVL